MVQYHARMSMILHYALRLLVFLQEQSTGCVLCSDCGVGPATVPGVPEMVQWSEGRLPGRTRNR